MEASPSRPLHLCHLDLRLIIINRAHMLLHSIALSFLIYYRVSFFFSGARNYILASLWSLVFAAELVLAFIWVLSQAYRWRPVIRTVFPERLTEDAELPAIDVFVCTADPVKEPIIDVANTVLSAMALDYPPEKIHVYLSDDGGSPVTLFGIREAYAFARCWLPFCRKYRIKTPCPKAYFGNAEEEEFKREYASEKQKIRDKYELFEGRVNRFRHQHLGDPTVDGRDHSSIIEVIQLNSPDEEGLDDGSVMPLLVYVSREKRPSYHHHFKAGALNALLRVSGIMSNSPYVLGLDCDMYSSDPSSARQAMCFHMDPQLSRSLAFVQFPQRFRNISRNDIYDGKLRLAFWVYWYGLDGLQGPLLSGTCYYLKREALYGKFVQNGTDLMHLREAFGGSNEFINCLPQKSLYQNRNQGSDWEASMVLKEAEDLASCTYENSTKWGREVGFMYFCLVEDYFTSLTLHCKGWSSVYLNPARPQFLGTATTNLSDHLVQGTRWSTGLIQVGISRFCPLIYSLSTKLSVLGSMAYAWLALFPLYFIPLSCFGIVPQLCLLCGIPLYPEVSSPYFLVFLFIFFSSFLKELHEIMWGGHPVWSTWVNECRHWMIKSVTCHMYGSINAIMEKIGLTEASFLPTNKADDDDQTKLNEMGTFNFQVPAMFLVPIVGSVILNMFALAGGVARALVVGDWEEMLVQILLSGFILAVGYPVIEGMFLRKDKGRVPPRVTVLSAICVLLGVLASWVVLSSVN